MIYLVRICFLLPCLHVVYSASCWLLRWLLSSLCRISGLVAGFFVASIPSWVAWLKYASVTFYGFGLLLKASTLSTCAICLLFNAASALPPLMGNMSS